MTKFQHGDTVKCINNTGVPSLVVGMNYPVNTCSEDYVWLDLARYNGWGYTLPTAFSPDRFELTDEAVTFEPTIDNGPIDYEDEYDEIYGTTAESLLRKAASKLEDCHQYELAEEINKFLGEE